MSLVLEATQAQNFALHATNTSMILLTSLCQTVLHVMVATLAVIFAVLVIQAILDNSHAAHVMRATMAKKNVCHVLIGRHNLNSVTIRVPLTMSATCHASSLNLTS